MAPDLSIVSNKTGSALAPRSQAEVLPAAEDRFPAAYGCGLLCEGADDPVAPVNITCLVRPVATETTLISYTFFPH